MADRIKLARSIRRKRRVRAKVVGTAARPRVSVRTSLTGMYVQIIDDAKGATLAALRSSASGGTGTKVEKARALGIALAEKATAAGITAVVFDRGAKQYHGRVAALAEGLREGGLTF